MTRIIIRRKNEWMNRLRSVGLYLDGVKLGTIGIDETAEFEITEGAHLLKARMDWCSSSDYSFTVAANGVHTVTISSYKNANFLLVIEFALLVAHLAARALYGITYIIWLILPFFLVNIYYISWGRNRYLLIQEDKNSLSF